MNDIIFAKLVGREPDNKDSPAEPKLRIQGVRQTPHGYQSYVNKEYYNTIILYLRMSRIKINK